MEAYATTFTHLADLADKVGQELGLTDWLNIDQDRIDAFADATEDWQWIHTNPAKARQFSPYQKTVAHGFLVLSLASKFAYETYSIKDVGMAVNYGLDKVRFPHAVPVGALIRARVSLLDYKEIEGGARFKLKMTIELKGVEKPACVAEFIGQAYVAPDTPSPAAATSNAVTASSEDAAVWYRKEGHVALLTLNRPERYNAVNDALIAGLSDALNRAQNDSRVRAVVLTGNGPGFCAGADLSVFTEGISPNEAKEYIIANYGKLMRQFIELDKPIIGAINGTAAGVGCAFALACDLRIMSEQGSMRYAFINIGLGPDGGAGWFLARQVGYSRAFQIAVEGEKIAAEECLALGLTNKISPAEDLVEDALNWAKKLAEKPTLAIGITKRDLQFACLNDLPSTVAFEAEQQKAAFASHDLQEGVAAFLQKRKPRFIGK